MQGAPHLIHKRLVMRAEVLHLIRGFFRAHGFLEVETPIRIPAPLPEAHIDLIASRGLGLAALARDLHEASFGPWL